MVCRVSSLPTEDCRLMFSTRNSKELSCFVTRKQEFRISIERLAKSCGSVPRFELADQGSSFYVSQDIKSSWKSIVFLSITSIQITSPSPELGTLSLIFSFPLFTSLIKSIHRCRSAFTTHISTRPSFHANISPSCHLNSPWPQWPPASRFQC